MARILIGQDDVPALAVAFSQVQSDEAQQGLIQGEAGREPIGRSMAAYRSEVGLPRAAQVLGLLQQGPKGMYANAAPVGMLGIPQFI
ncbi:MAG: hypothetical protein KatS3mg043_1095 [Rhodothermaceae bacterium]|nr:MAG: hypothetical protein KatS3mg043_1095 [Rhodothermaceae bacterium]